MQRLPEKPLEQEIHQPAAEEHQEASKTPTRVQLLAVRIGKVGSSGQVQTHTTHFGPEDDVAITLRVQAQPSVAQFPVRVSGVLFGAGMGMYRVDDSADIAAPGAQLITLRFPRSEYRSDPLFLSIQIGGVKVYSEEITIDYK